MNYKDLFKDNTYLLEEPEVKELINFCEYWEKRCAFAESYISKNNILAWVQYLDLVSASINYKPPSPEIISDTIPPTCTKEWESADYCGEEGKCLKCVTKTK